MMAGAPVRDIVPGRRFIHRVSTCHYVMPDISFPVSPPRKPLVWLHGEIKSPPMSEDGRRDVGWLLGRLQLGESLTFPASRPMPIVGPHCHELRVLDAVGSWRVIYRIDPACIVLVTVFRKTTVRTPTHILRACRLRLQRYDARA
jgi:phage-related protein